MIYDYKDFATILLKQGKRISKNGQKLLRKIMEWKKIEDQRSK